MVPTTTKPQAKPAHVGLHVRRFLQKHVLKLSATIVAAIALADYLGVPFAKKFTSLNYPLDEEGNTYARGMDDAYTYVFCGLVILTIRELLVRNLFLPIAAKCCEKKIKIQSFAEQMYYALYWAISFSWGAYHVSKHEWWLNTREMWAGYPHTILSWDIKLLYMVEGGFVLSNVLEHFLERMRKDFWEMLLHHVVTTLLITVSYAHHFTRVGSIILVNQDFADILLPIGKCLIYSGLKTISDTVLAIFMLAWFVTRLVFLPIIVWSCYFELPALVEYKYDPENEHYFTFTMHVYYCVLLTILVVLMFFWFWLVAKVAYKSLRGKGETHDSRSDEEPEDDDVAEAKKEQ